MGSCSRLSFCSHQSLAHNIAFFLFRYRNNSGGGGYNFGAGATNVVVDGGDFSLDAGHIADGGPSCVLIGASTALIHAQGVNCSIAE